jgi:N-acetyl-anhydromuramyl-L-alanine amidase AmpD
MITFALIPLLAAAWSNAAAPAACPAGTPKDTGKSYESCPSGGRSGACEIYDPPLSNLCAATTANTKYSVSVAEGLDGEIAAKKVPDGELVPIHYDYFGLNDCRTSGTRSLKSITRVFIHNGGRSAEDNENAWKCRQASSHYTIQRDGTVYQHIGEERIAWSVGSDWNSTGIGIELNTAGNCDDEKYTKGKEYVEKYRDEVVANCAPTDAQYASLVDLLRAIAGRTSASFDVEHVVGHCENGQAGDPLAFNWQKIGLSNADKKAFLKKEPGADCRWYIDDDAVARATP